MSYPEVEDPFSGFTGAAHTEHVHVGKLWGLLGL